MAKKELTPAQKYSTDFERLTKIIIEYLFSEIITEIEQTKIQKDGGVDILVKVTDNNCNYRVFVESKLRSGNLNLRDISANIIIAFNKAALSIITVTNYNYTEQLETELTDFSTRSLLNIKILTGDQIKEIISKNKDETKVFPTELIDLIDSKKSRKKNIQTLIVDLKNRPLYKQFCEVERSHVKDDIYDFPVSWNIYRKELLDCLTIQKSVIITGKISNGKTTFIRMTLPKDKYRIISIDAYFSKTTKQLFLYLLMSIWGINERSFLDDLHDDIINDIISSLPLSDKNSFKSILLYLLDKNDYISALIINKYIINYIFKGILLHRESIKFVFHIQNIQYANKEILDILHFIINKSFEYNVCTIIDFDEELQNNNPFTDYIPAFMQNSFKVIDIKLLNKKEAYEYFNAIDDRLLVKFVENFVSNQTLQLSNLWNCIRYIQNNNYKLSSDHSNIDLWNPIDIIVHTNDDYYKNIMILLYLCEKVVPREVYCKFTNNYAPIDQLISYGYLSLQYDNICAENVITEQMLEKYVIRFPMDLKDYALKLDKVMLNEKKYIAQRIKILGQLQKYNTALEMIDEYYTHLKDNKQYSLCLKYLQIAIYNCEQINNFKQLEHYLCEYIEVAIALKDIYQTYIDYQFEKINELRKSNECLSKLKKRYDYIKALQLYKKRNHKKALLILDKYYNEFLLSKQLEEEWDGIILTRYALCIKETEGDKKALNVFLKLYKIDSKNYYIFNGYHSHVSCTLFCAYPSQAKDHYLEMEKRYLLNEKKYSIPFHLYADIAMMDLLKHDFEECKNSCEKSIGLSNSYSVYDELGRSYNILGCLYLCEKNYKEAYHLFENSLYILSIAQYKSFAWRTQLNLIYTKKLLGFETIEIKNDLEKCYNDFKVLYLEKIINLHTNLEEFYTSREYYALVLIVHLSRILRMKLDIFRSFQFSKEMVVHLNEELKLIKKNTNNESYSHCSYVFSDIIYMVG